MILISAAHSEKLKHRFMAEWWMKTMPTGVFIGMVDLGGRAPHSCRVTLTQAVLLNIVITEEKCRKLPLNRSQSEQRLEGGGGLNSLVWIGKLFGC
jgi:hypothetical protein